jgi:hypothetical protein
MQFRNPREGFSAERVMGAHQLLKNRVSDNVGGVKRSSETRLHALGEERHFDLVEELLFQPRLAS